MPAPTTDSKQPVLAVLQQFRILLRSMKRHYQSVERQVSLGGSQVWALHEIASSPDLSVGDLARRLAIHLSTASNLVGRMETLGLVTRQRLRGNQRVVRLRVTAAGQKALRRTPGPPVGLLQQALLDLPVANLETLHRELDVLLGRMKRRDARAHAALIADLWPGQEAAKAPRTTAASRGQTAKRRKVAPLRAS
jgi:DNA-binding MarR family transcriptional regulator